MGSTQRSPLSHSLRLSIAPNLAAQDARGRTTVDPAAAMSSWLASFLFSQQPEDEHAGSSSYGQPYSPCRSPSRGRASTRSGHAHAPSLSPEVSPTSGRKRERGWLPHSASSDQVPRASDVALSPTRAEGAFDTPRSYYAQAAAGSSSMRDDDHTGWTPPEVDADGDEEMPPNKKRKGLAGTVLSTALDAAIFTTALGYTAYQLWRDPPVRPWSDSSGSRTRGHLVGTAG